MPFVKRSGRGAAEWWMTVPATNRAALQLATARLLVLFHGTKVAQEVVQVIVRPIVDGLVGDIAAGGFQLGGRLSPRLVIVEISINLFVRRNER